MRMGFGRHISTDVPGILWSAPSQDRITPTYIDGGGLEWELDITHYPDSASLQVHFTCHGRTGGALVDQDYTRTIEVQANGKKVTAEVVVAEEDDGLLMNRYFNVTINVGPLGDISDIGDIELDLI